MIKYGTFDRDYQYRRFFGNGPVKSVDWNVYLLNSNLCQVISCFLEYHELSHCLVRDSHDFAILACCAIYNFCTVLPVDAKLANGCYSPPRQRNRVNELRLRLGVTHGFYFIKPQLKVPRLSYAKTYYYEQYRGDNIKVNCTLIRIGGPHTARKYKFYDSDENLLLDATDFFDTVDLESTDRRQLVGRKLLESLLNETKTYMRCLD